MQIDKLTALQVEPKGQTMRVPDPDRTKEAIEKQKQLSSILRIYNNSQDRLHQNMKRLEDDLKQVSDTMSYIREDVFILKLMEQRLESELKLQTSNFQGLYDSLAQFSSQWISNIEKQ